MTSKARWYQIKARGARQGTAEILVYGDIGESWFDESVTAAEFVRDLQKIEAAHLDVRINSFGGSVPDGLAIYNALRRFPGTVHTHVDGIAASIASLIAMAGERVFMAANAMLMIHAPWGAIVGNAKELRDHADMLDQFAQAMAGCYDRAGEGLEKHLALLTDGEDHYFTATEALAAGYVDELAAAQAVAAKYQINRFTAARAARRTSMTNENTLEPGNELDPSQPDAGAAGGTRAQRRRQREIADERADQVREIRAMFAGWRHHEGVQDLLEEVLGDVTVTPEAAGKRLLEVMARGAEPLRPAGAGAGSMMDPRTGYIDTHEPRQGARDEAIIDAIVAKATRQPAKTDLGRQLARRPLVEIAAQGLEWAGRRARDLPPGDIIKAALIGHGTSDFPYHLTEAGNRIAREAYQSIPSAVKQLARIITAPDFRAIQHLQLSEGPELLPVPEHAEYKRGSLMEAKETFKIGTSGRIFGLTRHAMVNDDLGAFGAMALKLGRAAATYEGKFLVDLLAENAGLGPTLDDGKSVIHDDHKNVGTPGIIAVSSIAELAYLMRMQRDIDGVTPINVQPTHILVPARREPEALAITQAIQPAEVDNVNPYQGRFQVLVDPRLDAISEDAWYMVSTAVDGLLVAFLDGHQEPHIETRVGWEVDGLEFKVRHDFGAGFVDFRGWARNEGASGEA